jgi:hypothetical protein
VRLLRGEPLDALARETGQPAGQISRWREGFLAAGREGLKTRQQAEPDRRLADTQRKIGELTMDNETCEDCSSATDTARRSRPASMSSRERWHDRYVQPSVRSEPGARDPIGGTH